MDAQNSARWQNEEVGHLWRAVVAHPPLCESLVFKGARILNMHLGSERQSLDVDSNFAPEWVERHPEAAVRRVWLEREVAIALRRHFEAQNPVRFVLERITVKPRPRSIPHPRGWDSLVAEVRIGDQWMKGVRNLPSLELEIAAAESLGPGAVEWMEWDGQRFRGYTLHRIAGEKLRAFLTSLPAYRSRLKGGERRPRAKDLYDLARILAARPIEDTRFWKQAAMEFRLACESRYVECVGLGSFREDWGATRQAYEGDATLKAIDFKQAEQALRTVVAEWEHLGVFPLHFPLPPEPAENP